VKVPDIDCNDSNVPWVNLLVRKDDFARGWIARLKSKFDLGGPSLSNCEE
jgi:hypothetical protein